MSTLEICPECFHDMPEHLPMGGVYVGATHNYPALKCEHPGCDCVLLEEG